MDPDVLGTLSAALLLAAATHDIAVTPSNTYSPAALRVASGDTVRWQASDVHPLVLDGEPAGPFTSVQQRRLIGPSQLRFHCYVHGGSGMTGVVTVGDFNNPPSVAVQRDTAAPVAGQPVAFRASASDAKQLPLRIDWDMDGDGAFERVGAGTQVTATFEPGSRKVTARAVDDVGATAEASHSFTVAETGSAPPPAGDPAPISLPSDTPAPTVAIAARRSIGAARLRRRGIKVTLTPSEDARVVAELRSRAGG